MSTIIVDLDGTLTVDDGDRDYPEKMPNLQVVQQLRAYREQGFTIAVFTARNMRTYAGAVGKINVNTLPIVLEWLQRHDVPFDEVLVGKPWCGEDGFYVDDRAIRPSEFVTLSPEQIQDLLLREAKNLGASEEAEA